MPASDNLGPQWRLDPVRSQYQLGAVHSKDLGPSPTPMGKSLGANVEGIVTYAGDIPRVDENGVHHYDEPPTERWMSSLEETWTDPNTGKPDADRVANSTGVYRTMKRATIATEARMKRLAEGSDLRTGRWYY